MATVERKKLHLGRNLEQNLTRCRRPSVATAWEGEREEEKMGRWREKGERERTLIRSSRIQAEPLRGFWIQEQYQASGE